MPPVLFSHMNKAFFCSLLCLPLLPCTAGLAAPVGDYAQEVLEKVRSEEAERRASYLGDPALFEPETVLLTRFELDVTGDGQPETFLSATLEREPALSWRVIDGASQRPIAEDVVLDPRMVYTQNAPEGLRLSQVTRQADGSYGLQSYQFSADGTVRDFSKPLSVEERRTLRLDGAESARVLGDRLAPAGKVVLLEQFAADPLAPWRPWDRERSAYAQVTGMDLETLQAIRENRYIPTKSSANLAAVTPASNSVRSAASSGESSFPSPRRGADEALPSAGSSSRLLWFAVALAVLGVFSWRRLRSAHR